MSKEAIEQLSRVIWGTVKTILISFVLFFASTIFMSLMFYRDAPAGQRDFTPVYYSMVLIFGIAFYNAYLPRYSDERVLKHTDVFKWKEELLEFIRLDGKYLFVLYAILAVLFEIGYLFNFVPLTTVLSPCFMLSAVITVPILRTVIAYIVSMVVIMVAALIKHYRDYKYWTTNRQ